MTPGPVDIRDYLAIFWARKWTIVAVAVVSTSAAIFYASIQPASYEASADVLVRAVVFATGTSSTELGVENIDTEAEIASSSPVADLAEQRLDDAGIEPADTSAQPIGLADSIRFTSVSQEPETARASANAYARAYIDLRLEQAASELEAFRAPLEEQIDALDKEIERLSQDIRQAPTEELKFALISQQGQAFSDRAAVKAKLGDLASEESLRVGDVLRFAGLPTVPIGRGPVQAAAIGLVVGLALGIALALFRDRIDDRVRGRDELEIRSGAPILAFIPRVSLKGKDYEPITLSEPDSEAAEAYRTLRLRLEHAATDIMSLGTFVVTSSLPAEGKTTTAVNLAVAFAQAGRKVVLVGADLRRPELQNYFRGTDGNGLTNILTGRRRPADAVSSAGTKNLWVLPAGQHQGSRSPLELLSGDRMAELTMDLREFADVVILDTPPMLTSSDVIAIAPLTDGVLFVTDPRIAERPIVEQARREIQALGVPLLGVVVNRYNPRTFRTYGSSYAYAYGPDVRQETPGALGRTTSQEPRD